jgi:hypothetical protein
MKGLDVSNITLSDFILDCSTKFSQDSQLSSRADRLEIYYKPTDGQWRQLFGDDVKTLVQTSYYAEIDDPPVIDLCLLAVA